MYHLRSDEAGSAEKWLQCVTAILIDEESSEKIYSKFTYEDLELIHDAKFSKLRTNAWIKEKLQKMLDIFVDSLNDLSVLLISWESGQSVYQDMYEEVFLLTQSIAADEIQFFPDQNNALKWYEKSKMLLEYGIIDAVEQDSETAPLVQIADIISGITIFLREHHGTYRAWKTVWDRHKQMEQFDRELHLRCELIEYFFLLLQNKWYKIDLSEEWLWSTESDKLLILEY